MASIQFIEKIQGAVFRDEQTYSYRCSFMTRNGNCPSERGIERFGPKRLAACRRHGRMYEEERERLMQRLAGDHKLGIHGTGETRKPFAETHTDDSGLFNLICTACRDEIAAEELGVDPDKLEQASRVQAYVERIQQRRDSVAKSFREAMDQHGIVYAMDYYGSDVRVFEAQAELVEEMINRMNGRFGDKMDIVDAYNVTANSARDQLINDRLSSDQERAAAARFVRLGSAY